MCAGRIVAAWPRRWRWLWRLARFSVRPPLRPRPSRKPEVTRPRCARATGRQAPANRFEGQFRAARFSPAAWACASLLTRQEHAASLGRRCARSSLVGARASAPWISRYREITQYVLPFAGRYFAQDRNRRQELQLHLRLDRHRALDILAAGNDGRHDLAGAAVVSPRGRRPAAHGERGRQDLAERCGAAHARHLRKVEHLPRAALDVRGARRVQHRGDIIDPNFDTVIWNHPLTAGEYAIACDKLGRVEHRVSRVRDDGRAGRRGVRLRRAHGQLRLVEGHALGQEHVGQRQGLRPVAPVLHGIEPRLIAERSSDAYQQLLAKNMPLGSCYLELGQSKDDVVLRESGYEEAPCSRPRWHTRGRDIYGNGPGMEGARRHQAAAARAAAQGPGASTS
jgi:hypothetical protein